jgi:hypothetical protein
MDVKICGHTENGLLVKRLGVNPHAKTNLGKADVFNWDSWKKTRRLAAISARVIKGNLWERTVSYKGIMTFPTVCL